MQPSPTTLVIGYGNTLRSDDGVGPRVVTTVEGLRLPGVTTLVCHQLSPEHADPISKALRVIFVDASVENHREVQCRRLQAGDTTQLMAHSADPATMLALSREVFGITPEAWWVTIPIANLEFSEALSPMAQSGHDSAVDIIQGLCSRAFTYPQCERTQTQ